MYDKSYTHFNPTNELHINLIYCNKKYFNCRIRLYILVKSDYLKMRGEDDEFCFGKLNGLDFGFAAAEKRVAVGRTAEEERSRDLAAVKVAIRLVDIEMVY